MLKSAIILIIFVYISHVHGGEHEYPEHEEHEGYGYHEGSAVNNGGYPAHGEDYEHEHGDYEHEHGDYEHGDYEHEDHYNHGGYNQGATGNTGYNNGASTGHSMNPIGNMVIHSPNPQGFMMVYDVSNPDRAGSFYYAVREGTTTTPKPSIYDIRMGTLATCANRFQQVDDQMTVKNIPCTLQAGKQYMVWCVTDKDSNGRDADYCNKGVGGSLSLDSAAVGHGVGGHGIVPGSSGQHGATGHFTGALPGYKLVLGDHTCDFEEEAFQFVKVLPPTSPGDVDACASAASIDVQCSEVFYGGGVRGVCGCVRANVVVPPGGKACDEEESEAGSGIYRFQNGATGQVFLESSNSMTEAQASWFGLSDTMFIILTTYCFACCCLGSIYAAVQYHKKRNLVSDGAYAIYLDEENAHK